MRGVKKQRTKQVIKLLHTHIGKRCYLCMKEMPFGEMTADHVFPRSFGYSIVQNAMPACHSCNVKKGNIVPPLDLIQFVADAYDAVGMMFDPRIHMPFPPKPIAYYIHRLSQMDELEAA